MNNLQAAVENKIKDLLYFQVEKIKEELLELAQYRVPVDTKTLAEEGITGVVIEDNGKFKIQIFVNNLMLQYPGGRPSINARELALKLEVGIDLKRSQSKIYPGKPTIPAGSPTAEWWENFVKIDVPEYLNRFKR